MTKTKTIYTKWVVEGLLKMGFHPVDTYPNPLKLEFMCWEFEDTHEFEQALTCILHKGGQRNG